jgi:hypothetical protein
MDAMRDVILISPFFLRSKKANPRREDSIILEEEKPEKKPEKKMKLGEVLRKWYTNKSAPANSPSQFTILFVMGGNTKYKKKMRK